MKTSVAIAVVSAFPLLLAGSVSAKQHGKKHEQHPQPQQAPPPPIGSRAPSIELAEFETKYLDKILAPLDQQISLPRTELSQFRASFNDRSSSRPANEKPAYQAAVRVCDAISAAMDERERSIASLQGSAAIHGPSDLGAHRKDRPSEIEYDRERHEERNRKREAANTDNFFTTQLKTAWTQRTIQLRQNIDRLYQAECEAERQASQPAAANAAPPVQDSITLEKPVQVKVKYGTATIPAGTMLRVVKRDRNGVVVEYGGEQVLLPP